MYQNITFYQSVHYIIIFTNAVSSKPNCAICLQNSVYLHQNHVNIRKLKRFLTIECCKQCRHVKFKGTMTKWPVHKQTHRAAQNTQNIKQNIIQNKLFYVFFWLFYFFFWLAVNGKPVLFWKGISGLKFPCFLFYAC